MTKHNFKIGDKVKIICADKATSTITTRLMTGRIAKIIKFSGITNMPYSVYFEDENITLNFMEKELKLAVMPWEQLMLFEI